MTVYSIKLDQDESGRTPQVCRVKGAMGKKIRENVGGCKGSLVTTVDSMRTGSWKPHYHSATGEADQSCGWSDVFVPSFSFPSHKAVI
jgi:hypothetical protein